MTKVWADAAEAGSDIKKQWLDPCGLNPNQKRAQPNRQVPHHHTAHHIQ